MRQVMIFLFLWVSPLAAAIFHTIDTTLPLQCQFSMQQHNRILIDSGRIKKLIFPEDKLHVRMEEISGQVFVQARGFLQEKIILSIISQNGVVQDLEIEFTNRPSEVVILHEALEEQEIPLQEVCCAPSLTCDLASIVETILHGQIPPGFLSVVITNFCKAIKPGIQAKLVGRLKGCNEDLYVYQIHNSRIWTKGLLESDFACNGTLWVYLQKRCLRPKEMALAIVAVRHE